MKVELDIALDGVEHDHTRLDVLFEDLGAIAAQSLRNLEDPTLLEDARSAWQHLHEEIAAHLAREERWLFTRLASEMPGLKADLDGLVAQHVALRRQLHGIAALLLGGDGTLELAKASFEHLWRELAGLWAEHSAREWDLLKSIRNAPGFTPGDGQT